MQKMQLQIAERGANIEVHNIEYTSASSAMGTWQGTWQGDAKCRDLHIIKLASKFQFTAYFWTLNLRTRYDCEPAIYWCIHHRIGFLYPSFLPACITCIHLFYLPLLLVPVPSYYVPVLQLVSDFSTGVPHSQSYVAHMPVGIFLTCIQLFYFNKIMMITIYFLFSFFARHREPLQMISCAIMQNGYQHRVQCGRLPIRGDFQTIFATFHSSMCHSIMQNECHHSPSCSAWSITY